MDGRFYRFETFPELDLDEGREAFYEHYFAYMRLLNVRNVGRPTVGKKLLDLYIFYKEVTEKGGLDAVIAGRGWKDIATKLGLSPSLTSTGFQLRTNYVRLLFQYEQKWFHGKSHNDPLVRTAPSLDYGQRFQGFRHTSGHGSGSDGLSSSGGASGGSSTAGGGGHHREANPEQNTTSTPISSATRKSHRDRPREKPHVEILLPPVAPKPSEVEEPKREPPRPPVLETVCSLADVILSLESGISDEILSALNVLLVFSFSSNDSLILNEPGAVGELGKALFRAVHRVLRLGIQAVDWLMRPADQDGVSLSNNLWNPLFQYQGKPEPNPCLFFLTSNGFACDGFEVVCLVLSVLRNMAIGSIWEFPSETVSNETIHHLPIVRMMGASNSLIETLFFLLFPECENLNRFQTELQILSLEVLEAIAPTMNLSAPACSGFVPFLMNRISFSEDLECVFLCCRIFSLICTNESQCANCFVELKKIQERSELPAPVTAQRIRPRLFAGDTFQGSVVTLSDGRLWTWKYQSQFLSRVCDLVFSTDDADHLESFLALLIDLVRLKDPEFALLKLRLLQTRGFTSSICRLFFSHYSAAFGLQMAASHVRPNLGNTGETEAWKYEAMLRCSSAYQLARICEELTKGEGEIVERRRSYFRKSMRDLKSAGSLPNIIPGFLSLAPVWGRVVFNVLGIEEGFVSFYQYDESEIQPASVQYAPTLPVLSPQHARPPYPVTPSYAPPTLPHYPLLSSVQPMWSPLSLRPDGSPFATSGPERVLDDESSEWLHTHPQFSHLQSQDAVQRVQRFLETQGTEASRHSEMVVD